MHRCQLLCKSWANSIFPQSLKPHYKPLIWGVGTAVALFATFRVSKSTGSLRKTPKGSYLFDKLQQSKSQTEKLSEASSIPVDIFLSLIVGVSAALFLTDDVKMKDDLARMPLVQGRSLISEELCFDFIKEHDKIQPQVWTSKEAIESSSMQAIRTFVHNCQKRESLIHSRQKELHSDRKDAGNIPSPGVLEHISPFVDASEEQKYVDDSEEEFVLVDISELEEEKK